MLDMRNGTCAVCNHHEVIDAPALEYTDDDSQIRLAVTHAPDSLDFLQPRSGSERPFGVLRMLVCRSCGFVQWFATRPERIPINEAHGTKLVVPKTP
ncbi:MAG TPA: hypothetical protein VM925_34670 [Labilithrix sp.]|nr:hypothetical protein [Labilithrix sp.]